jgi:hypothetical protein
MTTLPPKIPFSQDTPVNSENRTVIAFSVGRVSNLATEDSPEEWQSPFPKPAAMDLRTAHNKSTTEMGAFGNEGA